MAEASYSLRMQPASEETGSCNKCGNDESTLLDQCVCCSSPYDDDVVGSITVNTITYTTCLRCGHIFQAEFIEEPFTTKLSERQHGDKTNKDATVNEREIPPSSLSDASRIEEISVKEPLHRPERKEVGGGGRKEPAMCHTNSNKGAGVCSTCGRSGPENFTVMRDQRDGALVMQLCVCGASMGAATSESSSSPESFVLEPCAFCGNQDPKLFMLRFSDDMDGSVVLGCLVCKGEKDADSGLTEDTSDSTTPESKSSGVDFSYECKCGNKQLNNFTVYSDEDNIPVDIECGDCHVCLPLVEASAEGSRKKSGTADAISTKAEDSSLKEECEAKSKTKKGMTLDKAAGHVVSFMGFQTQDDCSQYFARYGVRCFVKRAAYAAMDYGLDKSQQLEFLDHDAMMSGMGVVQAVGESGPDIVSLIGSKSGTFAALRQTYVEVSSLGRDVARANERRAAGAMNRERYVQLVVRRVGQSLGSVMGGTTGSLVGGLLLSVPVPVIGSIAGLTVGALLGQGVGGIVGHSVGGILGKDGKDEETREEDGGRPETENEE